MSALADLRAGQDGPGDVAGGEVRVTSLTKRFGAVTAVDDVSFTLAPGTLFALLGPSGCGKTTLLRLLAGFEQPDAGGISLGTRSLAGVPPYRRPLNTVFQHYALFPHMDVAGNVGYALRQQRPRPSRDEQRRRITEALDLVRLHGYDRRRVWELSGGPQQRVALARALITHPTVLLLDEPLGALDLKLRTEMQAELKTLQERLGITFIFVTHDQNEALSMADRVAVMRDGRIQQEGPPFEVYDRPVTRWVAGFIGQMNVLPGAVAQVTAATTTVRTDGGRLLEGTTPAVPLAPGDHAVIAVRPERIRLARGGAGTPQGWQGLTGRLERTTFLGEQVEYRVRTARGTTVIVRAAGEAAAPGPATAAGEEVALTWRASDARVLADEPT